MCGHVAGPSRCPALANHPGRSLLSSTGRRGRRLLSQRQRATFLPCYHAVLRVRLAHLRDADGPADCAAGQAKTQSPKSGFQCRQWFGRCDRSVGSDTAFWRKHHPSPHLSHRHHHRMLDTSHGALHSFRLLARFPVVQPTASARDSAVVVIFILEVPQLRHEARSLIASCRFWWLTCVCLGLTESWIQVSIMQKSKCDYQFLFLARIVFHDGQSINSLINS